MLLSAVCFWVECILLVVKLESLQEGMLTDLSQYSSPFTVPVITPPSCHLTPADSLLQNLPVPHEMPVGSCARNVTPEP